MCFVEDDEVPEVFFEDGLVVSAEFIVANDFVVWDIDIPFFDF